MLIYLIFLSFCLKNDTWNNTMQVKRFLEHVIHNNRGYTKLKIIHDAVSPPKYAIMSKVDTYKS